MSTPEGQSRARGPSSIRVRMYNVGFGDCFLISFPASDRERLVLIDCGVHSASKGKHELKDVIKQLQSDVEALGGRIEVVVATHRHRDHVFGFQDAAVWASVAVGEVWMPWTEDPQDPTARQIRESQSKKVRRLLELQPVAGDKSWQAVQQIADNNLTNAPAMATLHDGFAGNASRHFLPEADGKPRSESFTTTLLPGVTIHILGPARDEQTISEMDPPADDAYLRLGESLVLAADGGNLPFERWRVSQDDFRNEYGEVFKDVWNQLGTVVTAGRTDALAFAVGIEHAVNNTSLMLAFQIGDNYLLFPGDAQWGTWNRAIGDERKAAILGQTNFYKVGHHGSRNATPMRFVTRLFEQTRCALVSVAPTSMKNWDIPRGPLIAAMAAKCEVIRADKPEDIAAYGGERANWDVKAAPDGLWIDVTLPVWHQ